ncbi:conserved hypothetical protein, partial [Streptomyces sp. SPB78]|uniref:hypothetical protein n=1 Tax=Streptomyces sp. (strain SPB78) TaxID=591157 RepID=UPI0001B54F66
MFRKSSPAPERDSAFTGMQRAVLALAIVPMIGVMVAGGIGTYSNLSGRYGSGTAVGALAAGEGATAVLAFLLLGLTLLGQASPLLVRVGLWALPAAAATVGALASTEGAGQTVVYALTPMAITAGAEGLAFLVRRIVVHTAGRDVEAEARQADAVRRLAYLQAVAAGHPEKKKRERARKQAWKVARTVGQGDTRLADDLLGAQRTRLASGADAALAQMFTPDASAAPLALPAATADTTPALPAASTDDVTASRPRDVTIQAETSGYPTETASDQPSEIENVRPLVAVVPPADESETGKRRSLAADVREMVANGVAD